MSFTTVPPRWIDGDSQEVSMEEQIWHEQPIASIYSYFRASIPASWSHLRSMTDTLVRPEWTQTGWCDFLNGNFQSEISFESHLPQQAFTEIVSLQEFPLASDSIKRIFKEKLKEALSNLNSRSSQSFKRLHSQLLLLTSNAISDSSLVTSNRSLRRPFNNSWHQLRSDTDDNEKRNQKQKLRDTSCFTWIHCNKL